MTLPDPSPLTAEEQALAERLARLGPRAEPSPELDARVLAAAHAAVRDVPARKSRRRPRWPALVGVAASMVLAIGLAWRLRPQPEPPVAARGEPVAASRMVGPPPPEVAATAGAAPEPSVAPPTPSRDAGVAAQAPAPEAKSSAPAARPARTSGIEPSTPPAQLVLDAPSPMALPPPPPPAEAGPGVAPQARAAAAPAPPATPAPAAQDSGFDTAANEAEQASGSSDLRQGDEPSGEVPPATVKSPAVRDAWLERIHGLVDAGDIAGARASLREFERRYPDYPLPEDLRALAR